MTVRFSPSMSNFLAPVELVELDCGFVACVEVFAALAEVAGLAEADVAPAEQFGSSSVTAHPWR
jgi:hypothetical protein